MDTSIGGTVFSVSATKRIGSDLKEISKYPIEGIGVVPRDEQIGVWTIYMEGPKGTPLYVCVFYFSSLFRCS